MSQFDFIRGSELDSVNPVFLICCFGPLVVIYWTKSLGEEESGGGFIHNNEIWVLTISIIRSGTIKNMQ